MGYWCIERTKAVCPTSWVVLLRMSLLLPVPRPRKSHGPVRGDNLRPDLGLPEVVHEFRFHGERVGHARVLVLRTRPSRPRSRRGRTRWRPTRPSPSPTSFEAVRANGPRSASRTRRRPPQACSWPPPPLSRLRRPPENHSHGGGLSGTFWGCTRVESIWEGGCLYVKGHQPQVFRHAGRAVVVFTAVGMR